MRLFRQKICRQILIHIGGDFWRHAGLVSKWVWFVGFRKWTPSSIGGVMVYIGHFSFESQNPSPLKGGASWHGYFTCVSEGECVETALAKFEALLHRLGRTGTVFSEVKNVYLDSCIEIRSIPVGGFLAYYWEGRGECREAISTSLPGVKANQASDYRFYERRDTETDTSAREPFVVLDH